MFIVRRLDIKKIVVLALLTAVVGTIAACGGSEGGSEGGSGGGTLEALQDAGAVQIGIFNEAPYAELREDGTLTGFVPELTKLVMERLDVPEVDATVTGVDSLIAGLSAGQWDLIATGLAMTPERCAEVIYSTPDTASGKSFVVEEGNPLMIDSFESIASNTEITVATQPGSTERQQLLDAGVEEDRVVNVGDTQTQIKAVTSGRADTSPFVTLSLDAIDLPDGLVAVEASDGGVQASGIAFRPEDEALRDAFNEELEVLKEDGTFAELSREFGFDPETALETTNREVDPACAG